MVVEHLFDILRMDPTSIRLSAIEHFKIITEHHKLGEVHLTEVVVDPIKSRVWPSYLLLRAIIRINDIKALLNPLRKNLSIILGFPW